jgi:transketolase
VYDDNHITIDGKTELTYTDDVPGRFRSYGWDVRELGEVSEDMDALEHALREGIATEDRPTLLVLRSHIGYPSPNFQDSPKAHGEPLGADEVARVKELLGLPPDKDFYVPDDVLELYRTAGRRGAPVRERWEKQHDAVAAANPERAEEFDLCVSGRGVAGWEQKLPSWSPGESLATRVASQEVLTAIFEVVPGLIGGGGDLTGNTGTMVKSGGILEPDDASGRIVHFGIREHGMAAAANGVAVSGPLPFVGTFFVFSDYMRPSVRLAAMMRAKVAFVWTHDSVGLGEDGPTHQPIEHLAAMRAMPGLRLIRGADANEVAQAWRVHIDGEGPTGIVLTRQKLPVLEGTAERAPAGVPRGAYVLVDESGDAPDLVLIGTGSEVSVCVGARDLLADRGVSTRVVSMPSWELFEGQTDDYRFSVLPPGVPTLAVEAASSFGWSKWADDTVSIDRFGESAPGEIALARFGYTPENVTERALALLGEDLA